MVICFTTEIVLSVIACIVVTILLQGRWVEVWSYLVPLTQSAASRFSSCTYAYILVIQSFGRTTHMWKFSADRHSLSAIGISLQAPMAASNDFIISLVGNWIASGISPRMPHWNKNCTITSSCFVRFALLWYHHICWIRTYAVVLINKVNFNLLDSNNAYFIAYNFHGITRDLVKPNADAVDQSNGGTKLALKMNPYRESIASHLMEMTCPRLARPRLGSTSLDITDNCINQELY